MRKTWNDVSVRQVGDRGELERALELVHDNYVQRGLMQEQASGIRLTPHFALPTTRTLVARLDAQIVATVTLFSDSALGVPLESVYPAHLESLRRAGRRFAEVGMLADRWRCLTRGVDVLLRMMKRVLYVARELQLDDLVIAINPRHAKFYTRLLCFERFGPERSYEAVAGAPAVLLRLNVAELRPEDPEKAYIRELFFTPPCQRRREPRFVMHRDDVRYFFVERTNLLRSLPGREAKIIARCHPGLHYKGPASESELKRARAS